MDLEQHIAETVARQKAEDAAGRAASADPLPGPAGDAVLAGHIQAGRYRVRPYYDGDFELFKDLGHPLHQLMVQSADGKSAPALSDARAVFEVLRGPAAWSAAWVMTHPTQEVASKWAEGCDALRAAAKAEFCYVQTGELLEVMKAVLEQQRRNWAPVIGYAAKPAEGEQGPNPPAAP